jgi:hypothetical protein
MTRLKTSLSTGPSGPLVVCIAMKWCRKLSADNTILEYPGKLAANVSASPATIPMM